MKTNTVTTAATTVVLDVAAAAAFLGRSENAIYCAVRKGLLPARKHGARLLFLKDELEAYLRRLPRRSVGGAAR